MCSVSDSHADMGQEVAVIILGAARSAALALARRALPVHVYDIQTIGIFTVFTIMIFTYRSSARPIWHNTCEASHISPA